VCCCTLARPERWLSPLAPLLGTPRSTLSTLSHGDSDSAGDNLRKFTTQPVDVAIDVIEPSVHIELDVPQLPRDESELALKLRKPRLGEINAALQVLELIFKIDGHG